MASRERPGFVRRHRVTVASWSALALVCGVLVAYAVTADGYPVHKAELNDGGIWITNQSMGAVGRQNVPVGQIDGSVFAGDSVTSIPELDVLQDGSAVFSINRLSRTVTPIDVSMAQALDEQAVSTAGSSAFFGGGSLGVLDPTTGKLWATTADPETGTTSLADVGNEAKPVATVGGDAVGAAGRDGTVYAASTDEGQVVTLARMSGAGFDKPAVADLDADYEGALEAMTVVGDVPVLLDDKGNLFTASEWLGNVGTDARLQQAGPSADEVYVATPDELVAVAVEGGEKRTIAEGGGDAAAPVRMSNGCAFAAWGSGERGTIASACGDAEAEVHTFTIEDGAELVFRTNRNQIVLNDQKSGMTWQVTDSEPKLISNWDAYREQPQKKKDKDTHKTKAKTNQPPEAKPDDLGARSGRSTILNVLDNDLIASDGILSIVDVKGVTNDSVEVRIAPDRQSLLATVAPGAGGTAKFRYTISDGQGGKTSQDDGEVTLKIRDDAGSGKPRLRENVESRTYPVASGGVVELAVTPDWRDPDYGDPVVVESVDAKDLEVSTTALGMIRVEAPTGTKGGLHTVDYTVTTGEGSVPGKARVQVVPAGKETVPAKAEPDVAAGEVNGPITIKPLDNDVPGADGSDPGAHLALAGRVAPVGGLQVASDLESGRLTVTGSQPGTYFLSYRAGFGAADRDDGQIRVDITPATPEGDRPVATPDTTAVHGLSPVTVDVLANDFDPRGRMLVVQNAKPSDPESQLEVAVIDGRWVRVNAIDGQMTPRSQSVTYTISNGDATAEGSINVTQREPLSGKANSPVPQVDRITVRAGDTAAAPVLDNDATPSGDPVGLLLDVNSATLGELRVLGPADTDLGTAYVAGRQVRYVAPDEVTGALDVEVPYVVENTGDPSADPSVGLLKVHVTPPPAPKNPNLVPTPRTLEGRVVQGDLVTLKLPPVGSDPDGDSVAVTGVATAPKLGRIMAFGANSLTFQAYPDAVGTDEFSYEVTDQYGEKATGTVRVGVVQAGEPQAPLAINDVWFADPDNTVDIDVLGNDLRTPGTRVEILPLEDKGQDVRLRSDQGPLSVDAPDHNADRNVTYTISNGLAESRGVVTVKGRDGYNNPPVTHDLFASPKAGAGTVEVDVLAAVFDVDGPESELELKDLSGVATDEETSARITGGKAVIPVKDVAQVLAYRVVDGEGAAAAAAIYVPARPTGAPYLKPGAEIKLQPGETKDVDLSELVEDPEGDDVVLTTADGITASPIERLSVRGADKDTLTVSATKSEGPGSVVFEVSDRAKLSDPEAHTAYISVPVQVGELKPVINCPTVPIEVPEGGVSRSLDVASICHVWTADPAEADELEFTADWKQEVNGVEVSTDDGLVQLVASGDARRGDTGVISVGAKGHDATGELHVEVIALPDAKLAPIRLDTEATKAVTVDVAQYVTSPLPSSTREIKVMHAGALGGNASAATEISGSKVTFTPKPDTDGIMRYRLEVSDVGGSTSSGRALATGEVVLAVVARPDAPKGLVAGQEMLANTVALTWQTPDNNGKRIDGYEVEYKGPSNGIFTCAGPPCRVTGLTNGDPYTFRVRAHNATEQNGGWSEWSNSAKATPDALTGPPLNPEVVLQRDQALTVRWQPPAACDCSDVQTYRVSWPGGVKDFGPGTLQHTLPAPNGDEITVKIMALNKKGVQNNNGPSTSVTGTGAGKPAAPGAPSLAPTNRGDNASKAIGISWSPVGANGPGPVSYEVRRTGGPGETVVCAWITATSCADDVTNDGTIYTYAVRAKNTEADSSRETTDAGKAMHISSYGSGTAIEASAPPAAPVIESVTPTGVDQTVRITFRVGASHGAANNVTCSYNGGATCGSWATSFNKAGEPTQTRTIQVGANGADSAITLRACNGGQANLCASSNTMSVRPYGPVRAPSTFTAEPTTGSRGDRTTSWRLQGDANGAPIRWTVTSSATGRSWSGTSGDNGYSASEGETLDYNTGVRYTVTIRDVDDGRDTNRGATPSVTSNRAETGGPNLSVSVTKGRDCSERPCTGAVVPCQGTCWYIVIHTSGFSGGVSCSYHSASDGSRITQSNWTQGGNDSRESWWWAGDPNSFFIKCDGPGSESDRSPNAW
ncbi:Ig-like domain-containing protein [Nocardioides sp.]|uniref:Ig-like domain-containing protein n=1 Tax=Nocardioides sp. TaxID=35761 RepID=UPI002C8A5868|nr:Ig-like domain-containing protein [Nocardioides sp.]HSX67377.1 Ig-like domain-containing protein [Nocardioides sp.]